jgi:hypothetical protein
MVQALGPKASRVKQPNPFDLKRQFFEAAAREAVRVGARNLPAPKQASPAHALQPDPSSLPLPPPLDLDPNQHLNLQTPPVEPLLEPDALLVVAVAIGTPTNEPVVDLDLDLGTSMSPVPIISNQLPLPQG